MSDVIFCMFDGCSKHMHNKHIKDSRTTKKSRKIIQEKITYDGQTSCTVLYSLTASN